MSCRGFDIHDGAAVQGFKPLDLELIFVSFQQAHRGDQQRVGPGRTPGGKDTLEGDVRSSHGMDLLDLPILLGKLMGPVDHHNVGKLFNAVQKFLKPGQEPEILITFKQALSLWRT